MLNFKIFFMIKKKKNIESSATLLTQANEYNMSDMTSLSFKGTSMAAALFSCVKNVIRYCIYGLITPTLTQTLSRTLLCKHRVQADCCSLSMKSYLLLDNCDYVLKVDLRRLGNYNVNEIKL